MIRYIDSGNSRLGKVKTALTYCLWLTQMSEAGKDPKMKKLLSATRQACGMASVNLWTFLCWRCSGSVTSPSFWSHLCVIYLESGLRLHNSSPKFILTELLKGSGMVLEKLPTVICPIRVSG